MKPSTTSQGKNISLIGALLLIVGSGLPWVSVTSIFGTISKSGYDGDGILTGAVGLLLLLNALLSNPAPGRRYSVTGSFFALLALALALYDLSDIAGRLMEKGNEYARISVGAGIYVTLFGAVVCVIGGLQRVYQAGVWGGGMVYGAAQPPSSQPPYAMLPYPPQAQPAPTWPSAPPQPAPAYGTPPPALADSAAPEPSPTAVGLAPSLQQTVSAPSLSAVQPAPLAPLSQSPASLPFPTPASAAPAPYPGAVPPAPRRFSRAMLIATFIIFTPAWTLLIFLDRDRQSDGVKIMAGLFGLLYLIFLLQLMGVLR